MTPDMIERYLKEVLGTPVPVEPWAHEKDLPFHLRDAYAFWGIRLFGTPCVLMAAKPDAAAEGNLRRHLDIVAGHASDGALAIYVEPTMASYERRRLIQQQVPFIVPGKQMFLPPLGLDLRQFFQSRPVVGRQGMSPATQALLFTALLRRPWQPQIAPGELNHQLRYTAMTVSRAVRELETSGLASTLPSGREKWLHFEHGPAGIWQRAQPHLRSPVARTRWALAEDILLPGDWPVAGLESLASRSELVPPAYPVRAVDAGCWKKAADEGVVELPVAETGAVQWQVWRYDPRALGERGQVDPLSLIVSLRDDPDERVQAALGQLEDQLPW